MKKIVCCAIIVASLFLVSCGNNAVPIEFSTTASVATESTETPTGTSATGTVATATTDTTETSQGGTTPAEVFVPKGYGSNAANMRYIETKSKILFLGSMTGTTFNVNPLYYYSKADGEIYPFCFDPFCKHENKELEKTISCIGAAMNASLAKPAANADPVYIDGRFYFVYFDAIYSCSEFATDLRVEHSFHEYDQLTIEEIIKRYSSNHFAICDFCACGTALLFKHIDKSGRVVQYTFDVKTKKLSSLTDRINEAGEKLGMSLYISKLGNDKIYFEAYINVKREPSITGSFFVVGDFMGCYEADYELKELKKVDFRLPHNSTFVTQKGFIYDKTENDKIGLYLITLDGKEVVIFKDYNTELNCKNTQFVYLTDDAIYYFGNDPVEMGIDKSLHDNIRENWSGGKIYKYDFKTRKIKCVFNDLRYDSFEIQYISENESVVLMTAQKYEKISASKVKTTGGVLLKAALDENGNFIDVEEVELE